MERLAADLTQRFGRGFSRQNIQYMRLFYVSYPSDQIRQVLSGKLARSPRRRIRPMASGESDATSIELRLGELLAAFPLPWSAYVRLHRSRTPAPVNSMEQRRCEEGGRFASSTGRSIPSSTSARLYRRTRPPC